MSAAPQVDHLLPGLGVVVWEFDWDTAVFTYVSPAAETVFGYPHDDWLAPGFWRRRIHPLDAEWVTQHHRAAHEEGRPSAFSHRMIGLDGESIWIRGYSEPTTGNRSRGVLLRMDSPEAGPGYRSFFDQITPHVYEVDDDGTVLWMSRSALEFHDRTLDGTVGHSIFELMPEDQHAKGHRVREEDANSGEGEFAPETFEMVSCTGKRHVMQVTRSLARPPGGGARPRSVLLVMYDVTDAYARVAASDAQADRLRSVFDGIPLGLHLWRVDDEDNLVFAGANRAADEILGVEHAALIGKSIAEAFPPTVEAGLDEVYREIALHGGSYTNSHIDYDDGAIAGAFDVRAFWSGHREAAVLFEEVTERQRAAAREATYRARLRALTDELATLEDRERRRFAEELHDRVTQSLVVCRMQLRQAQEEPERTRRAEHVEQALRLLDSSIRESRHLITDLYPPVLSELGLPVAIEWLVEQSERVTGVRGSVRVRGDRATHVPEETAALIFRSARELLANVARHADATTMEVTLDIGSDAILLEVRDDGRGFDCARIEHQGVDGGFGLFSVRERAEFAGGGLEVGGSPSGGACVAVHVPLK